jgi:phage terminase small subunit
MSNKKDPKSNLTPKQELFCMEYLKDLNATQAAIRAKYSEKTAQEQSSRLLSNVMVQQFIQKQSSKKMKKLDVEAEDIIKSIIEIRDICAKTVKAQRKDGEEVESCVDASSAIKSNELLGKYIKMFTDKIELSGDEEKPITVKNIDLAERLKSLKKKS